MKISTDQSSSTEMNQELIQLNGQLVNDEGAEWDYTEGKFKERASRILKNIVVVLLPSPPSYLF